MRKNKKILTLIQRDFLFNLTDSEEDGEFLGYSIVYKEDFSGTGDVLELEIWDENGEEINNPVIINELKDAIRDFIYNPKNEN